MPSDNLWPAIIATSLGFVVVVVVVLGWTALATFVGLLVLLWLLDAAGGL